MSTPNKDDLLDDDDPDVWAERVAGVMFWVLAPIGAVTLIGSLIYTGLSLTGVL